MSHYTAITIGPIYKIFSRAKRTREFWAASYLFSLLAKHLKNALLSQGVDSKDFILPNIEALGKLQDNFKGVGIYPDKIIFRGNNLEVMPDIINFAIKLLSEEIGVSESSLSAYLKVYAYSADVADAENPALILDKYLNQAELMNPHQHDDTFLDKILKFMKDVNKKEEEKAKESNTFLKRNFSQTDADGHLRIPSIIEISTCELARIIPHEYKVALRKDLHQKDDESEFIVAIKNATDQKDKDLKKKSPSFKTYHKYICILKADGDKMGATIQNFTNDDSGTIVDKIQAFSSSLINWGKDAHEELKSYGALPIYIGGDDILCFAPVANGEYNILTLIQKIRSAFYKQDSLKKPASLRFGLAIAYYKHPMAETLKQADDLLYAAKDAGGNCIALNYKKHSGSDFDLVIDFGDDKKGLFELMTELSHLMVDDKSFLSSVIYKIRDNQTVLEQIYTDKNRLWNFFQNNFEEVNDEKKKESPKYKYLEKVLEILLFNFNINQAKTMDDKRTLKAVSHTFSALRFVKFIKGLDDDK